MQEFPKLHFFILVVIRHVVVADQIEDSRGRDRRLEFVSLRDKPIRELAAIAHALNSQSLAIDPQITTYRRTHAIEHVLRLVAILVAEYRICKFLSITG